MEGWAGGGVFAREGGGERVDGGGEVFELIRMSTFLSLSLYQNLPLLILIKLTHRTPLHIETNPPTLIPTLLTLHNQWHDQSTKQRIKLSLIEGIPRVAQIQNKRGWGGG